jgi:predicted outer membrane repeat protein
LVTLALAVLGAACSVPAAGAAQPKCLVVNPSTGQTYSTLQEAVAAASPEDTLKVKGTCYGTTTIAKNLTIVGQSNPGFATATLDGQKSGSVVIVQEGVSAAIAGLTITGGSGSVVPLNLLGITGGGGILNSGSLTLTNSTVTNNTAQRGGGIYNNGETSTGVNTSLTLKDSTVSANTTTERGGGIESEEGWVTLNDSNVSRNTAQFAGGGISSLGGSLTLTGSTVRDNKATASFSNGGGIEVIEGPLMLTNSTVSGNTAVTAGGGIEGNVRSPARGRNSITLDHSTVTRNTSTGGPPVQGFEDPGDGGGIEDYAGTVTLNGSSSVNRNEAAGDGGGIYSGQAVDGRADSVILNDSSSVTRNTASGEGGGIYSKKSEGATLTFGTGWMGSVSGNEPDNIFFD